MHDSDVATKFDCSGDKCTVYIRGTHRSLYVNNVVLVRAGWSENKWKWWTDASRCCTMIVGARHAAYGNICPPELDRLRAGCL